MTQRTFVTTHGGLQRDTPPMRLFEKAKQFGIWNPTDIDFTQDAADWQKLTPDEHDVLLRLTSLFVAGEEAVTLDLLPLIMTMAREGRVEEELYLTTFLWEEAKHTDFFSRFLTEVAGSPPDLSRYHGPGYQMLFHSALPAALNALMTDSSPEAQIRAAVTYNMIVEGTLAETGYHAYMTMLEANGILPGTVRGVKLLKQDESRHIAYGIFLISRLVAEHPALWSVAEAEMNRLLMLVTAVIQEIFDAYPVMPFGLQLETFIGYAMMQYQKRFERIAKAQGASLEDVYRVTQAAINSDDA